MTKALLTEQELIFLTALEKGPKTIREIKQLSGITSVYYNAETLLNKELIQKSDGDYYLTAKGRSIIEVFR